MSPTRLRLLTLCALAVTACGKSAGASSASSATAATSASNGTSGHASSAATSASTSSGTSASATNSASTSASASSASSSAAATTSSSSSSSTASSSSSGGTATASSSSSSTSSGSGEIVEGFAYCPVPSFLNDNGDLGQPCTSGDKGDGGQGTCSAGEQCLDYGLGQRCTFACPQQYGCPGTSSCSYAEMPVATGGSAYLCLPSCQPTDGGGCPSGFACDPTTPNPLDPGQCIMPCADDTACNNPDAGTDFTCTSQGFCACHSSHDCINGAVCDPGSGQCYFACSATTDPQCVTPQYSLGCCTDTGSVSYCDFLLPGGGWAGGGLGIDAGFVSVTPAAIDNGGLGHACVPAADGGQGNCEAGQLCRDFGGGAACTVSCASQSCPGTTTCAPELGNICLPSCLAGQTDCVSGLACTPSTPSSSEPGVCHPACSADTDCRPANSSSSAICTDGVCQCTVDSDCGSDHRCDPTSGACYIPCGPALNLGCSTAQGTCTEANGVGYCDPTPQDAGFVVGAHTPWPQVSNPHNGPVLQAPDLVTITFNPWQITDGGEVLSYPFQSEVEAYDTWLATSNWLSTVGADYGVGLGTNTNVRLDEAPPTAVLDGQNTHGVEDFINAHLADGGLPAPTANSLYVVYYPFSTTIYEGDTTDPATADCVAFDAYHFDGQTAGGVHYAYAVIPDCGNGAGYGWGIAYDLQNTEDGVSHEVIEASTDPFLGSWFDWSQTSAWAYSALSFEVADMCLTTQANWVDPTTDFIAQRIWSTSAAEGDASPCVPAMLGEPFAATSGPGTYLTGSAGGTVTVPYQSWSTAPIPDWTIELLNFGGGPALTISPQTTTTNNGQSGTFQITIPNSYASGDLIELEILAYPEAGVDTLWWPVVIYLQ